jgi:RNA polymerase sigma-70 factor, ECF subfamily
VALTEAPPGCCAGIRAGALACPALPHRARYAGDFMDPAFEAGRVAWPDIDLSAARFRAYLDERGLAGDAAHGADLYLACACADGDPAALRAFEAVFIPQVPSYLSRLRLAPAELDEVVQAVRARLFVGDAPRIRDFRGQGALGAWLRVVAVRLAIDLRRAGAPAMQALDDHASLAAATRSPDLEVLRNRYRDHFAAAFAAALAALTSEQRTLLRLHYLDGVSMDELGRMLKVNRSTIFRRIGACVDALLLAIRDRLGEVIGVSTEELHSLVAALRSDLELSLGDLLRSKG